MRNIADFNLASGKLLARDPLMTARWIHWMDATALVPNSRLPFRAVAPWQKEFSPHDLVMKWRVQNGRKHLYTVESTPEWLARVSRWCAAEGWGYAFLGKAYKLNFMRFPGVESFELMICAPPSGLDIEEIRQALRYVKPIGHVVRVHGQAAA